MKKNVVTKKDEKCLNPYSNGTMYLINSYTSGTIVII